MADEGVVAPTDVAGGPAEVAGGMAAQAGKYLTFKLGDEEYGLEILTVTTIIGLMDITSVPDTPHYVRGVINLRGKVIPVVEMRGKFGLEYAACDDADTRRAWDKGLGEGREKIFQVRKIYNDVTFVDEFISGHRMAAGLTVARDRLEPAMARLSELLARQGAGQGGPADLKLDGALMPGAAPSFRNESERLTMG